MLSCYFNVEDFNFIDNYWIDNKQWLKEGSMVATSWHLIKMVREKNFISKTPCLFMFNCLEIYCISKSPKIQCYFWNKYMGFPM